MNQKLRFTTTKLDIDFVGHDIYIMFDKYIMIIEINDNQNKIKD